MSPAEPWLLIDAGNTRVKCGLFAAPRVASQLPQCVRFAAVPRGAAFPSEALFDAATPPRHVCAAITGSHPGEVARIVREWPLGLRPPRIISDRRGFPLETDVDHPERVGVDRLLNAVAANVVRPPGQPAIIVDSGTATTVDYVAADGRFCGGAILPGFDLCARALHEYTALLPLIEITEVLCDDTPPEELGRNTRAAITSGLYWGHVGAVKELLQRLVAHGKWKASGQGGVEPAEAQHQAPLLVLLTGGAARLLRPHLPDATRYEPHLALQGLALVAMRVPSDE